MTSSLTALKPQIIRAAEGHTVRTPGEQLKFKLGRHDTADAFTLALVTTQPGNGTPPHVHHREDELFIVVEGEIECLTPDGWHAARAGDVVYLPAGQMHAFRNASEAPSQHWLIATPGGFEYFFEAFAGVLNRPGAPDFEQLAATARTHGIELLPPERA